MLKILIIDDEAPARNRLRRMLADAPAVHVAGEAATGKDALRLIPLKEPDVLLLDISENPFVQERKRESALMGYTGVPDLFVQERIRSFRRESVRSREKEEE